MTKIGCVQHDCDECKRRESDQRKLREMIETAWIAGYYHAGYTNDGAYAQAEAAKCADELLGAK